MDCWTIIVAIATSVGALATAAMAVATFRTFNQNRDFRKGVVVVEINAENEDIEFIISNVGETLVTDLNISFGKDVKDMASGYLLKRMSEIEVRKFAIKPHETKKLNFETRCILRMPEERCEFDEQDRITSYYFNKLYKTDIHIKGEYDTICGKQILDEHIILKPETPNYLEYRVINNNNE